MNAQKIITGKELCCLIYLEHGAIESFEAEFANYLGVEHVVGTSMGRTALFALLKAINLEKDDEVIVPAYICEVVPNAVLKAGGIAIFVDINSDDYHISLPHLESLITKKTKAIIINHIFGYPEDVGKIKAIIERTHRKIYLIEDVAHALGAECMGYKVGSIGDAAIFSFTKNMVNVGGGAIATNDPIIATNARRFVKNSMNISLLNQLFFGMLSFFDIGRVGSIINNLFVNILETLPKILQFLTKESTDALKIPDDMSISRRQAHIASLQLNKLDILNEQRNYNQSILDNLLKNSQQIDILKPYVKSAKHVCTWYVICMKEPKLRDKTKNLCRNNHVYLSRLWDPIPVQQNKSYKQSPADVPNAIHNAHSTMIFKMNPSMSQRELERVGNILLMNLT